MHEVFDVHVEAGRRDAFGALRGLLTFFEQQRQEGEQRVSEERQGHECAALIDACLVLARSLFLMTVWAK